jgi:hypothetical protein
VSTIYHCGAVVNWLHTYETLRAPNVLGTLALLHLGTHKCSRARTQCTRPEPVLPYGRHDGEIEAIPSRVHNRRRRHARRR